MNVPEIRFKEFCDYYSDVLLEKCLSVSNKKNNKLEYKKEDALSVSDEFGVVNQIEHLGRSYTGNNISTYKILNKWQIVYTKSPLKLKPFGIIKVNNNKPGIVSVLYAIYDVKEGFDPNYISVYFEPNFRLNKYLLPLINKGAKNTINISDETALSGEVHIPLSYTEQQKIASYFQSLDSLIQTTSKKLASLKRIKAASLQSMFPQEGETVPKVRFKGFEGEWEEKSFSALYKKSIIKNDLTFGTDKIISVANMYYLTNVNVSDLEYLKTYNIMKLGDIAFEGNKSKRFSHGRFVENTIGDGIVSHVFVVFHPISAEHDINYWKYAINNENIMRNVLIRCTKSSTMMTDLVVDDFLKETILVPSYAEQQKIGAYFRNLDQQISLQTQRLEKLKQIKAACLDKMFV